MSLALLLAIAAFRRSPHGKQCASSLSAGNEDDNALITGDPLRKLVYVGMQDMQELVTEKILTVRPLLLGAAVLN